MQKFKKIEIIETDDEGFLVLKGLLPEGSIVWVRAVNDSVLVRVVDTINIDFIEKQINSIVRTLKIR